MSGITGLQVDTYYKAACTVGSIISASAMALGNDAFALFGAGVAIAGVGEWSHIRKFSDSPHPDWTHYQIIRVPTFPAQLLLWLGILIALTGLAGVAKNVFWPTAVCGSQIDEPVKPTLLNT